MLTLRRGKKNSPATSRAGHSKDCKGVFAALYRHAEALARETPGVVGLRLYVERDNANAQRTYEALGMQDEGYRIFFAPTP